MHKCKECIAAAAAAAAAAADINTRNVDGARGPHVPD